MINRLIEANEEGINPSIAKNFVIEDQKEITLNEWEGIKFYQNVSLRTVTVCLNKKPDTVRIHSNRKLEENLGLNSYAVAYTGYHPSYKSRVVNLNGKEYLKSVTSNHPLTEIDPKVLGGMPTVKGTRIPISLIISCLHDGMTKKEICEDYQLTEEEIDASISYVVDVLNTPFYEE